MVESSVPAGSVEFSLGLNNVLGRAEDVSMSFELGMNNSTVRAPWNLGAAGCMPLCIENVHVHAPLPAHKRQGHRSVMLRVSRVWIPDSILRAPG